MFLCTKPRLPVAGFRCGYSSVLVTWTFKILLQHSYSSSWMGKTGEFILEWGALVLVDLVGVRWVSERPVRAPAQT